MRVDSIFTPCAQSCSISGAGTGCVAELLVFNPEDRYEDIKIRREYVEMCRLRLAQDGVDLTELKAVKDENGNYTIRKIMN